MLTVFSNPSRVLARSGTAITPALFIKTSITGALPTVASRRAGSVFTDDKSARSSSMPTTLPAPPEANATSATAASALALERAATMMFAPAVARRLALSSPSPVFAPVMKIVVPAIEPAGGAKRPASAAMAGAGGSSDSDAAAPAPRSTDRRPVATDDGDTPYLDDEDSGGVGSSAARSGKVGTSIANLVLSAHTNFWKSPLQGVITPWSPPCSRVRVGRALRGMAWGQVMTVVN